MKEKAKRKVKEKGYKEGYAFSQVMQDKYAIKWELKLCEMLEYDVTHGKTIGQAILNLSEEYRWNSSRAH